MIKPYQFRVIQELNDLSEKLDKLAVFVESETFWDLPKEERALFWRQEEGMKIYQCALRQRVEGFVGC
jgi:hypothetical protein